MERIGVGARDGLADLHQDVRLLWRDVVLAQTTAPGTGERVEATDDATRVEVPVGELDGGVLAEEEHAEGEDGLTELAVLVVGLPGDVDLRVERHAAVVEIRGAERETAVVDEKQLRVDVD